MSDKGREAIADILAEVLFQGQREGVELSQGDKPRTMIVDIAPHCDKLFQALGSHGWLHLDDVVEGKYLPKDGAIACKDCGTLISDCYDSCNLCRQAKVRDLIGKGE